MIWSCVKAQAGAYAHRDSFTHCLDKTFDGDTVSVNILYTKESIDEINSYLNSAAAHIDPAGGLRNSSKTDIIDLVMHNITG